MDEHGTLFIGGRWVAPRTDQAIEVISPHTEEPIARVAAAGPPDVDDAVAAARRAFDEGPWPRLDPAERIETVRRLAGLYGERRDELADVITAELGAPISFARRAQVGLALSTMNALADIARNYAWQEDRPGVYGRDVLLRKEPVGVVAAVIPWNMPQFLTITKVIPALLAGCAVVLKPAPESPLDALVLAALFEQAGLPPGVVNVVPADRDTSAHLVAHPGIDKVSFTGSTAAGRQVAAACARNLTRVSLELGGKSAAIALDDADPAAVAAAVRLSGMGMAGQICNALTRVLVPAARADDHADALGAALSAIRVADPADPATEMGPLVTRRQQERVRRYIDAGVREGARLVVGGTDLPAGLDRGWYVRPTVFSAVDPAMTVAREEIFGPVLAVIPYHDQNEAVRIANDTEYGLAGSVFTADTARGLDVARQVRAGTFGVNQGYSMDPAAPFGGVKSSGYGRELGREGLEGYLDIKSISIA
ncbi:aldehyde dehydrogenase [Frankia sp. CNm7]|uniref:Aldehyde dehydrogenase n=1 Tax=Frankia nepalensis TaxID=1836974 RepID=A0A937RBX1_9ACTN|nr:aldehyde dehydrogenase [Frankia nepalensis]MBL7498438.1 aldehyde dehydrogenase [Frankia nepalensis]MBL7512190.1 aldehyde dehydrogenase [Frankia nepalensis]MBL7519479.1 aldehyde dehydrogenase [Frankia nepalensis]MBL7629271.1 aldehyde dehydrogenase [Frankia nepalensis]